MKKLMYEVSIFQLFLRRYQWGIVLFTLVALVAGALLIHFSQGRYWYEAGAAICFVYAGWGFLGSFFGLSEKEWTLRIKGSEKNSLAAMFPKVNSIVKGMDYILVVSFVMSVLLIPVFILYIMFG